jgi:hypothetical protein
MFPLNAFNRLDDDEPTNRGEQRVGTRPGAVDVAIWPSMYPDAMDVFLAKVSAAKCHSPDAEDAKNCTSPVQLSCSRLNAMIFNSQGWRQQHQQT